jgi:homoserine dehydrogenase
MKNKNMENIYKIAIVGCGYVGSAAANILLNQQQMIAGKIGANIQLDKILTKHPRSRKSIKIYKKYPKLFVKNLNQILKSDVNVVVESVGGTDFALKVIMSALKAGKHIVTPNKAVLARHGEQIFSLAYKKGLFVAWVPSVGGATPIVRELQKGYAADPIKEIKGIVNGTCNYILSEMEKMQPYEKVLKKAQKLGYAEADPSADVDGHDSVNKIVLLIWLAYGVKIDPKNVVVEGITRITAEDIKYLEYLNKKVRLIAYARKDGDKILTFVLPILIPAGDRLCIEAGVTNVVSVKSKYAGLKVLTGQGAGPWPTGSTVVNEIVDVVHALEQGGHSINAPWGTGEFKKASTIPLDKIKFRHTLRFMVKDVPGVLGKISATLGRYDVNINAIHQIEFKTVYKKPCPFIIVTSPTEEGRIKKVVAALNKFSFMAQPVMVFREIV